MDEKLAFEDKQLGLIVTTHRISLNGKDIIMPSGACSAGFEGGMFGGYSVVLIGSTSGDFAVEDMFRKGYEAEYLAKQWNHGPSEANKGAANNLALNTVTILKKSDKKKAKELVSALNSTFTKIRDHWKKDYSEVSSKHEANLRSLDPL